MIKIVLEKISIKGKHYFECSPFLLIIMIGFTPDKTRTFKIIQIFCRKLQFFSEFSIFSMAKSKLAMRSGPSTELKMDKTTMEVSFVGNIMIEVGPPRERASII